MTEKTAHGQGRPPKPIPKLGTTPEKAARAIFSAVKPPDPSTRVKRRKPRQSKAVG